MADYEFTADWFTGSIKTWRPFLAAYKPTKLLEIGSWEGRSTCFLIEECAAFGTVELHCVDTWEGGIEHDSNQSRLIEPRFDHNIELAKSKAASEVTVVKHKSLSSTALASLISEGKTDYFDFIYVDGSHQAPDVLADAVLSFLLARVGGLIVFDDYLWFIEPQGRQDHFNMPKPAVDAFVNIFRRKVRVLEAPLYQLYLEKTGS